MEDIIDDVNPINVCSVKGYGEIPAAEIIEKLGIKDQNDPKLHDATNELYKVEHRKGIISEHIPEYGGKKVAIAERRI